MSPEAGMLNVTEVEIDAFVRHLQAGYRRTYGGYKPEYAEIIGWAGGMALENIAGSDALYHNVEHTIYVTLVGQEILRGRHLREGKVSCEDWLTFIVSLLCHDIGYVKGVCRQDRPGVYATGRDGATVTLGPETTDAALTPHHVDRGKLFVEERFGGHRLIDVEAVKRNIEPTRFPVPKGDDGHANSQYPGLVRAADLIGQLGDPRYLRKIPALYYEFEETGVNAKLGYGSPADLRRNYASFYWKEVSPYIQEALAYLGATQQGLQMRANLFANVFEVEHEQDRR